jgi:arsenate reductase (thioredoxin)
VIRRARLPYDWLSFVLASRTIPRPAPGPRRPAGQAPPRETPKRVVFACPTNGGWSQMAAAFFNHAADARLARAVSAGLRPGRGVGSQALEAMRDAEVPFCPSTPRALTGLLVQGADHLVLIGCDDEDERPFFPAHGLEEWAMADPPGTAASDTRAAREEIRRRVVELIARHAWRPPEPGGPGGRG